MRTLLKPLPDELLYSTLGRATYRYGFWSPKRLLDIVYGRRTVVAVPDLPSNLAAVARATQAQWRLTAEELALRHTLVGYYTHFRGARRRSQVLAAMAAGGGSLQVRLGVCAGAARAPKRFRLCPRCHRSDVAQFGEPFWHRAHHLPGVLVCHLHGDILVESEVPFRPTGRHVYQAAPNEVDFSTLQPLVVGLTRAGVAAAVAVRSFELLTADACPRPTAPDYRPRLAQSGWSGGRGQARRFRAAFVDHFGEELIRASFGREDSDALEWLGDVLRAPRRPMHPFKHVLMTVFLDAQDAPLLNPAEGLEPCDRAPEPGLNYFFVPTEPVRHAASVLNELIRRAYASPRRCHADAPPVPLLDAPNAPHFSKACTPGVSPLRLSATGAVVGRSGMGKSKSLTALLTAGEWPQGDYFAMLARCALTQSSTSLRRPANGAPR